MKIFGIVCICALVLVSCGKDESPKDVRETAAQEATAEKAPQKAQASNMTDAQVFAYILGKVYGYPPYMNTPDRVGAMLDLDAMIQGIVDNEKALTDSTWELQLSAAAQAEINEYYNKVAEERKAAGANAPQVALAGPITGQKVVLTDTTSKIVKYSYAQGVMIDNLFDGMRKNFGEDFEGKFFIQGVRESIYEALDPSFKKTVPDGRFSAVNAKYKKRMEEIREERRRQ